MQTRRHRTVAERKEIARRAHAGENAKALSEEFGIHQTAIYKYKKHYPLVAQASSLSGVAQASSLSSTTTTATAPANVGKPRRLWANDEKRAFVEEIEREVQETGKSLTVAMDEKKIGAAIFYKWRKAFCQPSPLNSNGNNNGNTNGNGRPSSAVRFCPHCGCNIEMIQMALDHQQ